MANFTKTAIQNSFIKLLDEKPVKDITVMDIVNDCGVSRNTFYYHFQDVPELVESIAREDADSIIRSNPEIGSVEDCVDAIINYFLHNRKAVLHLYKSMNRSVFEQYHWRVCEYAVTEYTDRAMKNASVSPEDRTAIIEYMKSVCFGVVTSWLESGLSENVHRYIRRICELKQGDLQRLIGSAKKS